MLNMADKRAGEGSVSSALLDNTATKDDKK